MRTLKLKPVDVELYKLNDFIHEEISDCDFQIELMVEEIFVNIVQYSGCSGITVTIDEDESILFIDDGIKFNPLEYESQDSPKSIDEAEIGGQGIPLIKEIADEITYEYVDNNNYLKIIKKVR